MKVTTNGQMYGVHWRYDNPKEDEMHPHDKRVIDPEQPLLTTCTIMRKEGDSYEPVASATVKHHSHDPYSKDKARRFSLNKALHVLYPNKEIITLKQGELVSSEKMQEIEDQNQSAREYNIEQKPLRQPFWSAYNNRRSLSEEEMDKESQLLLTELIKQDKFIKYLATNEEFVNRLLAVVNITAAT